MTPPFWRHAPDVPRMFKEAAERIAGILRCGTCGAKRPCPAAEAERYLRAGWPTCCGETMTLERSEERP